MCGFAGLVGLQGPIDIPDELTARVQRALYHRGPDGQGGFRRDWLGLMHARLAVIDTSAAAAQPMIDRSGRFVIVFNGEIYNYADLYQRYCPKDGTVNGKSDTAVLLHLVRTRGPECLELLDGMFAFALVDLDRRKVLLARDRFGEKPLYWLRSGDRFAFASELRVLRALLPEQSWNVDLQSQAIFHMLASVPAPRTIYENVFALRAGTWLEVDHGEGLREKNYWHLSIGSNRSRRSPPSAKQGVLETQQQLLQAVASRSVADVPVGVFLSGGYDSSAIVGLLSAAKQQAATALCIDFEEARFSESKYAEITGRHYGLPVCRHLITADEFIAGLPGYFASMDQPTSDGYNSFFLSRAAAQLGVKVWLSGVGGDELFGGYPFFRRIGTLKALARVLQIAIPSQFVDRIGRSDSASLRQSRLVHLADSGCRLKRAYQVCRNIFPWRRAQELIATEAWGSTWEMPAMLDSVYSDAQAGTDAFQQATLMETSTYMRSQLLRDIDNFSMAHSIEVRAPFLDHRLFEGVYRLPRTFKVAGQGVKPLLAAAMPEPLPEAVVNAPKRGFTFPVETWLKTHIRGSFEDIALDPSNSDFWKMTVVEKLWDDYLGGRVHWSVVWQLYAFACWRSAHR